MLKLSQRRVSVQLSIGFGLILTLMSLVCGYGVWQLISSARAVHHLANHPWQVMKTAAALRAAVELDVVRVSASARLGSHEYAQKLMADRKSADIEIDTLQARLDQSIDTDELRAIFAGMVKRREALQVIVQRLHRLLAEADYLGAEELLTGEFERGRLAYYNDALLLMQKSSAQAGEATLQISESSRAAAWLATALCLGAMAFAVLFGVRFGRSITRRLREASHRTQEIAQGDLSGRIAADSEDEIGDMQRALALMQQGLRSLVGEVHAVTDSVAHGSREISSGTQDLSQRTERTAANLQKTSGTMSSLSSAIRQTAGVASSAASLAGESRAAAVEGGEIVVEVVRSMQNIREASGRIANITSVIDGIAFQTNILALNAAVEAARAGDQGRGFAVVAAEVRTLAQKSALSAREIKSLIQASTQHVETGSSLVQRAGSAMSAVVGSVAQVSELVKEVSSDLQHQLGALNEAAADLRDIDDMTQQNSALVEQSTAAADSLQNNAAMLSQRVRRFRLSA